MNDVAILGSGFGLYGYLPSIEPSALGRVYLPNRYKDIFFSRPELKKIEEKIFWVDNENDAIKVASLVIIALNPMNQERWVKTCLDLNNINSLILEKPLAHNPDQAKLLLSDLLNSKKNFEIGYLFRYTHWGNMLINFFDNKITINQFDRIEISWSFLAHHFLNNVDTWKKYHSDGGGVIRFFGIHLIALLSELGYTHVSLSKVNGYEANQPSTWEAIFMSPLLPDCHIFLDTRSRSDSFSIKAIKHGTMESLCLLKNPFEIKILRDKYKSDLRISPIKRMIQALNEGMNANKELRFLNAIILWDRVEASTNL